MDQTNQSQSGEESPDDVSGKDNKVYDLIVDPRITIGRSKFEKIVVGALKNCIDAHGAITIDNRSSAAKRIVNSVMACMNDRAKSTRLKEAHAKSDEPIG